MTLYKEPEMAGIRIDTGITAATGIKSSFDPMIAKLVVCGKDRIDASQLMAAALGDYIIQGIHTNLTYLIRLIQSEAFVSNAISTRFCDEHTQALVEEIRADKDNIPVYAPVAAYLMFTLARRRDKEPGLPVSIWETLGYWRNLMNIRLSFDGGEIMVQILRYSGNRYLFTLSGRNYTAVPVHFMKGRIDFTAGHNNYTAFISEDSENEAYVSLGGHTFRLKRHDLLSESAIASSYESSGHDRGDVSQRILRGDCAGSRGQAAGGDGIVRGRRRH